MKTFLYGTAALILCGPAAALTCDRADARILGLDGVTFTEVAAVPAGEDIAAPQCRIRGPDGGTDR